MSPRRALASTISALCALWIAIVTPSGAGAASSSAAKILSEAVQAADGWRSYQCKITAETLGGPRNLRQVGTLSYLRPGYLKMVTSTVDADGVATETRTYSDGSVTYTEIRPGDGRPVTVYKATVSGANGSKGGARAIPSDLLVQMGALYDLDLLAGGEEIDGVEVEVLAGPYRPGGFAELMSRSNDGPEPSTEQRDYFAMIEQTLGSVRLSIGRADKFLYRMEMIGRPAEPGVEPIRTITLFTDVILNPDLSPEDFAYTPPEGAHVIDRTEATPTPQPPEESGSP